MRPVLWAAALSLALVACGPRQPDPVTAFDGRVEDWTREILSDSPETAAHAAVTPEQAGGPFADRLDDRSPVAAEARRAAALRRLVELRALDVDELDASDTLTYSVLREQFEATAAGAEHAYGEFTPLGGVYPYVINQLDSAFLELPDFLDRTHTVNSFADAEAYLTRLRGVATALDQDTERARIDAAAGVIPPSFIIDLTVQMLDAVVAEPIAQQNYVTGFQRKLETLIARETDPAAHTRAEARAQTMLAQAHATMREHVIPAHQRQAAFLRSVRPQATEDAGVWRLPNGEAYYRDALKLGTTTDLTPDQIHRIGLDRVRDLNAQLDVALRRVGLTEGPVGARLSQLTADPRYIYPDTPEGRAELMADVQRRVGRVLEQAPRWFGRLPEAGFEVRPVPAYAEAAAAGASYSAPALDGSTPGVYFINLRNLSEITRIDLPTQDFHEAVPGHHFQVALAQELTDTPLLRRLMTFNAYGEGWGLYAEELADELGFHEGDPVGRIGYLRWQLWRAVRLVVDTGLHAKRWTRQQAIDYVTSTTGDTPGVISSEVDRYIVWPGQACGYELGRREIMRLREEARTNLGPDFDLRGFHDVVLLNGEVPLGVLDELVRDWIPRRREEVERERRRR